MQKSFSDLEYAAKKKFTRRDSFRAEPFYLKVTGANRLLQTIARSFDRNFRIIFNII